MGWRPHIQSIIQHRQSTAPHVYLANAILAEQAWGVLEKKAKNYQLARKLFRCAVKAMPQSEPSWQVRWGLIHSPRILVWSG